MRYDDALTFLLSFADLERAGGLGRAGDTFDLARMRALLALLDNPEGSRRTIHVAGSKGKGSVSTVTEALLREHGLRTGLFTSPHLHSYRERIALDGAPIAEDVFGDAVEALIPHVGSMEKAGQRPTTFELLTALGFTVFRNADVEAQVIEVGLGGRLDATNVLDTKDVCVITPVELEHTDILGHDLRTIAREKAGIVRTGVPVVMGLQRGPAASAIRDVCTEMGAPLHEVAEQCAVRRGRAGEEQEFRLRTPMATYDISLPLAGKHQMENAALAVRSAELFGAGAGMAIDPARVRAALAAVRLPGRVESLGRRPRVIFDAAHTPESAARLAETLRDDLGIRAAVLVIGASTDKDPEALARALSPIATTVVATRSEHPRAQHPAVLAAAFIAEGRDAYIEQSAADAFDRARALAGEGGVVLVTGSFYLVAELRALMLGLLSAGGVASQV